MKTKPNNINNKIRFICSPLISPSGGPVSTGRAAALGGVVAAKNAKGREEKKQKSLTGGTGRTVRTGGKDGRAEEQKRRREEKTMKDRTDGTNEKQESNLTGYLWGSVFPLSW